MAFDFERVHRNYDSWYSNELKRPTLKMTFSDPLPEDKPDWYVANRYENCVNLNISPKQLVDSVEYQLQFTDYAYEGFPEMWMAGFGPGHTAALLGCNAHGTVHTVWFEPENGVYTPIEKLHFEYDENNRWWNRLREVYRVASERFKGDVVIQMYDIGGVMDILASFVGTEQLLIDCIEQPEEVKRCVNEIQALWFRYFDEINAILKPTAKGYSHWAGMLHREPGYIFQSDFSYMISPEMFREFVFDEIRTSSARVPNAIYHQDGIGELPFTDMFLSIDSIRTMQWVPGDGEPRLRDWSEHFKKIVASGKKLYPAYQGIEDLPKLYRTVGDPGVLFIPCGGARADKQRMIEKVERDLEEFYAGK
ncbi:MAG: hypothetical protein IJC25_05875 [Clostridia bacterium]|nr:hypothetical protein [Clostridia bacterium]